MAAQRLSQNQKDALFILGLLATRGRGGFVPLSNIKTMIEQPRPQLLDPANFRKSMHTLASRGLIEMRRAHDLSLLMQLTENGIKEAAKIYQQRTGDELTAPQVDDGQVSIFDALEQPQAATEVENINDRITSTFAAEYSAEQIDEMIEKFTDVIATYSNDYDLTISKYEFECRVFDMLASDAGAFLNLRCIRNAARQVVGIN